MSCWRCMCVAAGAVAKEKCGKWGGGLFFVLGAEDGEGVARGGVFVEASGVELPGLLAEGDCVASAGGEEKVGDGVELGEEALLFVGDGEGAVGELGIGEEFGGGEAVAVGDGADVEGIAGLDDHVVFDVEEDLHGGLGGEAGGGDGDFGLVEEGPLHGGDGDDEGNEEGGDASQGESSTNETALHALHCANPLLAF